jgi:hypothetical protein
MDTASGGINMRSPLFAVESQDMEMHETTVARQLMPVDVN